ncbi:MAG: redoxin domain-containing protein [Alphaproteobacteria bacterium]|nr:redoxin domain-containing protein [Alphaproteobacteria bacterium]
MTTAYDFDFTAIDGSPLPLKKFAGEALLVVNVASKCGYTPQYTGLQKLYSDYHPRGFEVIGVPCNQFLWQEPAKETEIAAFCAVQYSVTFPMTEKERVKGGKAHPFYKWMREQLGRAAHPAWNFHKLLIGKQGQPLAAFPSRVEPLDPKLTAAIEAAL